MKSITERLHENRQIQLAKEILESNGYEVTKGLRESGLSDQYADTKWVVDKDSAGSSYIIYIDKISDDEYLLHDGRGRKDPDSDVFSKKELDDYFEELGSSVEPLGESIAEEDTNEVNEAIGLEYRDSVSEFFNNLFQALEILKSTEEGVIESIVGDDELYDRLQEYIYKLDDALNS